jgi:hypothetical protein
MNSSSGSALIVNGEAQGQFAISLANLALDDSVYIGAQGQVTGVINGFYLDDTAAEITNDGHVYGAQYGIESDGSRGDTITNDGVISTSGYAGIPDSAAITINQSEFETIQNAGLVSGPQAIYVEQGSNAAIQNSGTIQGTLTAADTAQISLDNSGVLHGALDLDSSANNIVTNSGKIHGAVSFGSGENVFTNSESVTGSITFGSGSDTLVNSGTITGYVIFTGTADQLTNGGQIHGNVAMGYGDILVNTGTIHGEVTLGVNDQYYSGSGDVTAPLIASAYDDFNFSGSLGHETIGGFVPGGATHDVIHFSNDEFANYTALQADMTQVGADVVITLDPNDSLVLEHMTLARLSSHDFTFGS